MRRMVSYVAVLCVGAVLAAAPQAFGHQDAQPTNAQLLVWLKRIDSRQASSVQAQLISNSLGQDADFATGSVQAKLNRLQGEINSANLSLNKICAKLGISNIAC